MLPRKIAYLIYLMLASVVLAFLTLRLLGITGSLNYINLSATELHLIRTRDFTEYPLLWLAVYLLIFAPFFLVMVILDMLTDYLLPENSLLRKYLLKRLISVAVVAGIALMAVWAYIIMFPEIQAHVEIMRRFSIIWYVLFQGCVALTISIMGWEMRGYYQGLPRWLHQVMLWGGAGSVVLSVLSLNLNWSITLYGLLYYPYCFALAVLATYIMLVDQVASAVEVMDQTGA